MSRNKLYSIILVIAMAGYAWFYWNYTQMTSADSKFNVCLFKTVTGLPCPSCGTTRAILCMTKGNFLEALYTNPLGFIVALMLVLIPVWVIVDIVFRKNSFQFFYEKSELLLRKKWIALPAVILILFIWILNIKKHL
jgi:hypothetical protein